MESFMGKIGIVDTVFLCFVVAGQIIGFIRGFADQSGKFVCFISSMIVALCVYEPISKRICEKTLMKQPIVESIVLIVVLLAAYFSLKIVLMIIARIVSFQFVYFVERVFGSLVGGVRYALFFCLLSYAVLLWPSTVVPQYFQEKSYAGPFLQQVVPWMKQYTDKLFVWVNNEYHITKDASKQKS